MSKDYLFQGRRQPVRKFYRLCWLNLLLISDKYDQGLKKPGNTSCSSIEVY